MSEIYEELKNDLLKIDSIKDEIIKIDTDTELSLEAKYAKLSEIALTLYIHSMQ